MRSIDVLFVCTANQCRSPMAEYLYRHHFCADGRRRCGSAGLLAAPGEKATRMALKAIRELGIDMRDHRSRPVSRELLDQCKTVTVMTEMHRQLLILQFPEMDMTRILLLGSFATPGQQEAADIEDPVGLSLDIYRMVRDRIAAALWGLDAWFCKSLS